MLTISSWNNEKGFEACKGLGVCGGTIDYKYGILRAPEPILCHLRKVGMVDKAKVDTSIIDSVICCLCTPISLWLWFHL